MRVCVCGGGDTTQETPSRHARLVLGFTMSQHGRFYAHGGAVSTTSWPFHRPPPTAPSSLTSARARSCSGPNSIGPKW